jgi:hypothetical protein
MPEVGWVLGVDVAEGEALGVAGGADGATDGLAVRSRVAEGESSPAPHPAAARHRIAIKTSRRAMASKPNEVGLRRNYGTVECRNGSARRPLAGLDLG